MKFHQPLDHTGQVFGQLTALRFTGDYWVSKSGRKKRMWWFLCSCGKEVKIVVDKVRRKFEPIKTCGCGKEKEYKGRDAIINSIFVQGSSCKYNDGDLTFQLFKRLIQMPCYYCGAKPSNYQSSRNRSKEKVWYSGLDRLDNRENHSFFNVVPCCHLCNTIKNSLNFDRFIDYCTMISDKFANKKL